MKSLIRKLFGRTYNPLNSIEISRNNLLHNYHSLISSANSIAIAPVLKSNAYGHGIIQVAKTLDPLKPPFFCVDSLYEGYELLKANIRTPILIMGYIDPQNLTVKKLPFSYAVYTAEQLHVINTYQRESSVHIKVDTGMHRLGVPLNELPEFIKLCKKLPNIKIDGLMSHFADAENPGSELTQLQIKNFLEAREILTHYGINPKWIHIAASNGLLHCEAIKLTDFSNIARVGLAMYGIGDTGNSKKLKPVLQLITKIVQIKTLKKGDFVGYNGTFIAPTAMKLGILPLGFYDGVDRRLSNVGYVTIDTIVCPIVGRVSMNLTTIDISNVRNPFIGQKVIVFSHDPFEKNSITNASEICKTTPYDLLVHLASSTKRSVI